MEIDPIKISRYGSPYVEDKMVKEDLRLLGFRLYNDSVAHEEDSRKFNKAAGATHVAIEAKKKRLEKEAQEHRKKEFDF